MMANANQQAPASSSDPTPASVPTDMYTAMKDWAQVQEEEYLLEETVTMLANAGIVAPWQLQEAPDALLQAALPLESHGRHYLAAARTRTQLKRWDEATPDAMAQAIQNLAKVTQKVNKGRKRGKDESDSEDDVFTESTFAQKQSLEWYGLDDIPAEHLPALSAMKKAARRAEASFKRHKQFLLPGTVADYKPTWFDDQEGNKDVKDAMDMKTHAHWVSAWWARALTQLACQGHAAQQTLSVADLVTQFLNANRIAIEKSSRVGWSYDKELWQSLGDRVRRCEKVQVNTKILEVDENKLKAIMSRMESAKQEAAKSAAKEAAKDTRRADTKGRGKAPFIPHYQPVQPQFQPNPPAYPHNPFQGKGRGGGKGNGNDKRKGGGKQGYDNDKPAKRVKQEK